MKLYTYIAIAMMAAIGLSSCTTISSGDSTSNTSMQLKNGALVVTQDLVLLTTYQAIKKNPNLYDAFQQVVLTLQDVMADSALTIGDLKTVVTNGLNADTKLTASQKTKALLALNIIFISFDATTQNQGIDITKQKEIIDSIVNGIDKGCALYDATDRGVDGVADTSATAK